MPALINFEYRKFTTDFNQLVTLRDGYHNDNEAWEELMDAGAASGQLIRADTFYYSDERLLIGNCCCAEAVFSNPVNDLAEYKKWQAGYRSFPYLGEYGYLNISKQERKKPSEAVKGALGEIIGGLLFSTRAQIMVRPIQRYPDFIGLLKDGTGWAYLEAKCFEKKSKKTTGLLYEGKVPQPELKKICLLGAKGIKHNNCLTVYASFTRIDSYNPLTLTQTIIEISDIKNRRNSNIKMTIPQAYIETVVYFCVEKSCQDIFEEHFSIRQDYSISENNTATALPLRKKEWASAKNKWNSIKDNWALNLEEFATIKLKDIEEKSNLPHGEITQNPDINRQLTKACEKKAKTLKSKQDFHSFKFIQFPKNLAPGRWVKCGTIDPKRTIYSHPIDTADFAKVNTASHDSDWKLKTLTSGQNEVYAIGNCYVAASDANQQPKPIKGLRSQNWNAK